MSNFQIYMNGNPTDEPVVKQKEVDGRLKARKNL